MTPFPDPSERTMSGTRRGRLLTILAAVFAIEWIVLAIAPLDRKDWMLENVLVGVAVLILAATHRRLLLSKISYVLIFVFLCLHEVGAHYTYAEIGRAHV